MRRHTAASNDPCAPPSGLRGRAHRGRLRLGRLPGDDPSAASTWSCSGPCDGSARTPRCSPSSTTSPMPRHACRRPPLLLQGRAGPDRACLSLCLWDSQEQARAALSLPRHQAAARIGREVYETSGWSATRSPGTRRRDARLQPGLTPVPITKNRLVASTRTSSNPAAARAAAISSADRCTLMIRNSRPSARRRSEVPSAATGS